MTEQILALVRLLLGCGAAEDALLAPLELAAEAEMNARMKEGILPADCAAAYLCAVAFLTVAAFKIGRAAAVASFSAGDLAVREKSAGEITVSAENLRAQGFRLMQPYCGDGDFCFCGVRG